MTVYQCNNPDTLIVEGQKESWLCWAAVTKAVAEYYGLTSPDQEGLATLFNRGNSPYNPMTALSSQNFGLTSTTVLSWADRPQSKRETEERAQDLRDNLVGYLQFGPLIGQFTEAKDKSWVINSSGGQTDYLFSHAVILRKFDDTNDEVTIADPASTSGRKTEITALHLVNSFQYARIEDLGPRASQILVDPPPVIFVRLKALFRFEKP